MNTTAERLGEQIQALNLRGILNTLKAFYPQEMKRKYGLSWHDTDRPSDKFVEVWARIGGSTSRICDFHVPTRSKRPEDQITPYKIKSKIDEILGIS